MGRAERAENCGGQVGAQVWACGYCGLQLIDNGPCAEAGPCGGPCGAICGLRWGLRGEVYGVTAVDFEACVKWSGLLVEIDGDVWRLRGELRRGGVELGCQVVSVAITMTGANGHGRW